jgi:hypothetical protein
MIFLYEEKEYRKKKNNPATRMRAGVNGCPKIKLPGGFRLSHPPGN